jgi:hypothetical protein
MKVSENKFKRVLERKEQEKQERILKGLLRDEDIRARQQRVRDAETQRQKDLMNTIIAKEMEQRIRLESVKLVEATSFQSNGQLKVAF